MKLSLIVPCYNEQDNVREFYRVATQTFMNCGYDYEFMFVNDGSRDNTLNILKEIYDEDYKHVNVVSFSRNFGKEAAIYAGLKNVSGDYISVIDADLQQRPELVLDMAKILDEDINIDCVAAYQKERHEGVALKHLKNLFYKIINRISDVKFFSGASDFRTMRRPMAEAILELREYHRFSKGLFAWVGFETYFMPYVAEERFSGKSKWSFFSLFRYAINGILAFTVSPLKLATYLGGLLSAISIIYMIIVICQKLIFGIAIPGYPTIISIMLLIGGVELFILGIIGEYIARMYIETKRRPIYIEKLNLKAHD